VPGLLVFSRFPRRGATADERARAFNRRSATRDFGSGRSGPDAPGYFRYAPCGAAPQATLKRFQAGSTRFLEILKINRFGINAALKKGNPRWNGGRNQNKQTK